MRTALALLLLGLLLSMEARAAGFTETLPAGTFLLDTSFSHSWLAKCWNNDGKLSPLLKPIERYEPGGGKQGTLVIDADVQYSLMVMQLHYGILGNLSLGLGIPLVLRTRVDPSFGWKAGDFQPAIGRVYSQDDFWAWASSMGQGKPGTWTGNKGVLGDIVLGLRLRYTDWILAFDRAEVASSLTITGAFPSGRKADTENPLSTGTTMWDLHSQGELGLHLAFDKSFKQHLDSRLTLGLDLFYEAFFPHTYQAPHGTKNPLLVNLSPYIGKTYTLDPGDFLGFAFQTDVTLVKGPARASWISKRDLAKAEAFPPLWTLALRYTFVGMLQSEWTSKSDLWDYEQEDRWRPGYKNVFFVQTQFSFLRLGAPLQLYVSYRSLRLIPGRNTRAAEVLTTGFRIPAKFW